MADERIKVTLTSVSKCSFPEADEDDSDRFETALSETRTDYREALDALTDTARDKDRETDYVRGYRDALEWVLAQIDRSSYWGGRGE